MVTVTNAAAKGLISTFPKYLLFLKKINQPRSLRDHKSLPSVDLKLNNRYINFYRKLSFDLFSVIASRSFNVHLYIFLLF